MCWILFSASWISLLCISRHHSVCILYTVHSVHNYEQTFLQRLVYCSCSVSVALAGKIIWLQNGAKTCSRSSCCFANFLKPPRFCCFLRIVVCFIIWCYTEIVSFWNMMTEANFSWDTFWTFFSPSPHTMIFCSSRKREWVVTKQWHILPNHLALPSYENLSLRYSISIIEAVTQDSTKESLKKKHCVQILERMRGREVVGDRRRKGGVTGQRREVREEVTQPNTLNEKNKCQIQIQKPSQIQIQLNEKNKCQIQTITNTNTLTKMNTKNITNTNTNTLNEKSKCKLESWMYLKYRGLSILR